MTLYRTAKVAVILLCAVQLGMAFTASEGSMPALQTPTQQPTAAAAHGGTAGLAGHAPFVSFATLIYQAYP